MYYIHINVLHNHICILLLLFRDGVNYYALYIAEDDGEIDFDFPCLDSRETVAKFGFGFLAIVERDSKLAPAVSNHSPASQ